MLKAIGDGNELKNYVRKGDTNGNRHSFFAYYLCKAKPEIQRTSEFEHKKGAPEISGGIKLRGRAVEKFADSLPTRKKEDLKECPYEDLLYPKRVHIDI